MRVTFTRTGDRRYGVSVTRTEASDLEMNPAPGYDDWLPHDMVHFIVERETGLKDGIFGQVAAGGDAHTFVPTDEQRTKRWARRSERRNVATGRDIGRSEELAFAANNEWNLRAGRHTASVVTDPKVAAEVQALMPALEDAANAWHALSLGESLTFDWPWHERPSRSR
jgi:hypothetical protein